MGKRKYRPTGYDTSRQGAYVTIHNPKKPKAKRNRRVQRVRKYNGQQYYYMNDYSSKQEAKKHAKASKKRGAKARVTNVHGRHVVYHRKGRR